MNQVQMFTPSSSLSEKVTHVDDAVSQKAMAKAQRFVNKEKEQYPQWLDNDLQALKDNFQKALTASDDERILITQTIFKITLEIKGQGGSYDYPLISYVGDNMCTLLDSIPQVEDEDMQIIKIHIDALSIIAAKRMKGTPKTPESEQMLDGLAEIVQKRLEHFKEAE